MLDMAESERASEGGGDGRDLDDTEVSSSFPLSRSWISTVDEWCQDWPAG